MTIRNCLPTLALLLPLISACTPQPFKVTPDVIRYPKFPTPPANLMQPTPKPSFLGPTSTPAPKTT